MATAQMVKRSVYPILKEGQKASDVEPLRTGLVPKDLQPGKNGVAWMSYWAEQDKKQAEREAAEAEAAAAALAEPQEPVAPDLQPEVAELRQEVMTLKAQIAELEQMKLASPEMVAQASLAFSMAAGSAEATILAGQQAREDLRADLAIAEARLAEIEGQVSSTAQATGQLLADVHANHERNEAERDARLANAISKRVMSCSVEVSQMRGPRGLQGPAGSGTSYGKGKPPEKHPSGREWFVGEGYIDYSKVETLPLYVRLTDGWDKPVPTKQGDRLINASITHVDQAPRASVVTGGSTAGRSFGGGGGEKLLVRTLTPGAMTLASSAARWQVALADRGYTNQIAAADLTLVITAVNGSLPGESLYLRSGFVRTGSGFDYSPYSQMGGLFNQIAVNFDFSSGTFTPPSTYTGATSITRAMQLSLSVNPMGTTATTFLVSGAIEWLIPEAAALIDPVRGITGLQPGWDIG